MFYSFILVLFSLFSVNLSELSEDTVSMPMVDHAKAALIADLDMSEMNKVMKVYIEKEVNRSIESALKTVVGSVTRNISREIEKKRVNTTTGGNMNIRDCSDIKQTTDGVYHIYPTGKPGYKVYCDMTTDGGGWTVFQRRFNGKLSFYDKTWVKYANGFGKVDQEYWLGNDKLHQLTKTGTYVLRVNVMDWDGQSKYAVYDNFKVDNGGVGYMLHLGRYSGTAGNSMNRSNNQKFTTIDKHNDGFGCSKVDYYRGAWWYPHGCGYSNLNGEYVSKGTGHGLSSGRGIHWEGFRGFSYSLKRTQMMFRKL